MKLRLLLLFLFYSCNTLDGHRGISGSLAESLKMKVFKHKVNVHNKIPQLQGVKNVWIENGWNYDGGKAKIREGYETLIFEFEHKLEGYGTTWEIVSSGNNIDYSFFEITSDSTTLFKEGDEFSSDSVNLFIVNKIKANLKSQIRYSAIK
jgi:hypothetical protein